MLIYGGVVGRTAAGRSRRTRPICAIGEGVRINLALWQLVVARLAG